MGITCLLLVSCASEPETPKPRFETMAAIQNAMDESQQDNNRQRAKPVSESEVSAALLPRINLNLPGSSGIDTETRFDIKVNRARARQFFIGLVEGTPYNMTVDPRVKGRITLNLKNVTVRQVMDTVRDVYGYDYEVNATGYKVYPNEMATRIFKVNYLDIKRKGTSQVRVNSGQLTDMRGGNTLGRGGYGGGYTGSGGQYAGSSGRRNVQASSQIDTTTESTFWKELEASLKAMVGNKKGRSIVVSAQSGVIVVRAMPHELRMIERYLTATQNIIQRQVILEAKIIEVQLGEKYQAGINWSALAGGGSNSGLFSHIGGGSVFDGGDSGGVGTSSIFGNSGNLDPSNYSPINGSSTSAFGGVFTLALTLGTDFAAFIELLKGQGNVQVLSSPRISTLNNSKAVIKVGQEEFFVTNIYGNIAVTSGASTSSNNIELTPFFSGVVLDVVPQISEQGMVTLFIHPSVSKVAEQNKEVSLTQNDTMVLPLAYSTVRESDTIISARSGQVVVIGGLMQEKKIDLETSVPFFGDLPIIGGLFRHFKQETVKSELVILLKPIVVEADGKVWNDVIHRSQQRINAIHSSVLQTD